MSWAKRTKEKMVIWGEVWCVEKTVEVNGQGKWGMTVRPHGRLVSYKIGGELKLTRVVVCPSKCYGVRGARELRGEARRLFQWLLMGHCPRVLDHYFNSGRVPCDSAGHPLQSERTILGSYCAFQSFMPSTQMPTYFVPAIMGYEREKLVLQVVFYVCFPRANSTSVVLVFLFVPFPSIFLHALKWPIMLGHITFCLITVFSAFPLVQRIK